MRQSLAGAAARGVSRSIIAHLLEAGDVDGLLAHNAATYGDATMMAKDEDADDDDDTDDDDSDESDDDDDDADDDEDTDKGSKKPDARARRLQELAAEAKRHRLKARDYRKERDDALAEVEKLKNGKGKPKEKDTTDDADSDDKGDDAAAELKSKNAELEEKLVAQQLRSEFNDLVTGSNAIAQFANPKTAFKLLDLDDVEIVDGDIEGLEDAIKALAKSDPYLLAKDDDDEDEDEVSDRRRRRSTGQPTGGRKSKADPNREALISKYPALRR